MEEKEVWNLDISFAEWLFEMLKEYKKEAIGIVDLKYRKIKSNGKEYTQLEAIDYIIEKCEKYISLREDMENEDIAEEGLIEATHLWAEILPYMWI